MTQVSEYAGMKQIFDAIISFFTGSPDERGPDQFALPPLREDRVAVMIAGTISAKLATASPPSFDTLDDKDDNGLFPPSSPFDQGNTDKE